ncbi:YlxR family protein [Dactylococcopsis salina]|uniref:Nucleic-acid-binding protein implicated in transcription termination n=1 Tax=Dactylococcopsis salina (strain PCC 8305) TaxID=13035 RepID=K9YRD6_DACS8|nr:YlxR family protein [Dactylococcopsis salina]AFZ49042.1 putative nucleic-acid-binding protein implicated in transcription termination [Dactylococcopsis salina PCC 8305]
MEKNYRRCLSCRRIAPKEEFLRIVRVHPSRKIQLDQGMGRSAYVCPCASCLKTAQHKNRLGRAIKAKIPPTIYQELENRINGRESSENLKSLVQ